MIEEDALIGLPLDAFLLYRSAPDGRRLTPGGRRASILGGEMRQLGRFVLRLWRRRRESNPCTRFCRPLPEPLGHVATDCLAAPRGFEPRFTDPKSAVLPLDDGAPDGASR